MSEPLWQPSEARIGQANMTAFTQAVERRWAVSLPDYAALHEFSLAEKGKFWRSVAEFAGLKAQDWGDRELLEADRMPGAGWFPDARLNFAENLLRRRDEGDALVFWGEDQVRRRLSHGALYDQVSRMAQALKRAGIGEGDRVSAYLANMPEAVIAMLAATSLGAVWSSCSPEFGTQGVLDRFGQIAPRILIAVEGYFYAGKAIDCLGKIKDIQAGLPSLEQTVIVPYWRSDPPIGGLEGTVMWDEFQAGIEPGEITFAQLPFAHPLCILYSSGTTGAPKCIVHGAGGTLLKHASEQLLHCDIKRGDRVFYFTTCGWMMWNWLVSNLICEATLLLYDGSPFHPDGNVLFHYADHEAMTLFGTSAKFIDAVKKAGLEPRKSHDLSSLRLITSTGSPLVPESFDFVYQGIKRDIHLASISGGTDIHGCFVLGNPTQPVWRGEIQTSALGVAIDVFDDDGRPLRGAAGDLVCTQPFPSMPIYFWNDEDGAKYRAAYFEKFPGVWCHGDWVELTEHGGMIIHGRSDATLNPAGVRIGTAEIYRQVEQFDQVLEGLCVGQDFDGDTRIVLFLVLAGGAVLDQALSDRIRQRIRANCSPRHVPAKIIAVPDIPRTRSGKISELAVRDVIHGRTVKNVEALADAAALDHFKDLAELAD